MNSAKTKLNDVLLTLKIFIEYLLYSQHYSKHFIGNDKADQKKFIGFKF